MNRQFYVVEQLGPNQSVTPDGFLLCEAVPIARTGIQIYGPNETNVTPGDDNLVYIMRLEEEVFRPETIASFNGKPVLNEHPERGEMVTPETWKKFAVGVVLNARRGTGEFINHLLADMLICDPHVIDLVRGGKREVSCGYSADWEETSVGHGEQKNIIGNHVAIVEHARCGESCSIGDRSTVNDCSCQTSDHSEGGSSMKWEDIKKKLMAAFRAKDDVAFDAALSEAKNSGKPITIRITKDDDLEVMHGEQEGGGQHKYTDDMLDSIFSKYDNKFEAHDTRHKVHDDKLKAHDDKFKIHDDDLSQIKEHLGLEHGDDAGGIEPEKAIEGHLKEEAPPGTGDAAIKQATDSSLFADSFRSTMALGEVLVPGINLLTFDKAKKPKQTFLDMCAFRRRALILASKDRDTALMMTNIRNGRNINDGDIQAMNCGQVRDFFYAVGGMKKQQNNSSNTTGRIAVEQHTSQVNAGATSLRDVNRKNREKWGNK